MAHATNASKTTIIFILTVMLILLKINLDKITIKETLYAEHTKNAVLHFYE